jgi:hypothetical protein
LDETTKGYIKNSAKILDQQNYKRKVRSTKIQEKANTDQNEPPLRKMHDVYVKTFIAKEAIYTDQTGRFPANSSSGHKYIMVFVKIDSNFINAEPMTRKQKMQ